MDSQRYLTTTESEHEIEIGIPQPVETKPEKIDRRKIKRAPWRTTVLEDGTIKYNDKPNDPHYHAKYYHAKRRVILCSPVNCEICGATVSKAHLTRHKQTTQNALDYKTHQI